MDRIRQALDLARRERDGRAPAPAEDQTVDASGEEVGRRWTRTRPPVEDATADGVSRRDAPAEPPARVFDVSPSALERNRIVMATGDGAAARAFRMLRTQVLQRMQEHGWRTLGVAAARSGDGKTTVAVNLALAIARSPQQTALLVDLDLSGPGVASCLGLEADAGIEDVLSGTRAVPECLYRPRPFADLVVLPARSAVAASSEIVAAKRSHDLIAELRERYSDRIVIFDLPPVLEVDDAAAIAPHLDCLLIVVAEYQTARDDVARALQLLVRTPVVGTVLNRSYGQVDSGASE